MTDNKATGASIQKNEVARLLSSAGLVLLGGIFGSLSKLLERVIIARWLSPAAYGEVSTGIAIMGFSVTIALIGLKQGVPRFMSRVSTEEDVRGTWMSGLLIAGVMSLLVVAALLLNVGGITERFFDWPDSRRLLVVFALCVPFVAGLEVGIGAIRGLENTLYRTYTQDLLYPGSRILLIVVLLFAGAGILAAGYAYLLAAVATFLVSHYLLNRLLPLAGQIETNLREMTTFSIPLVVSTILSVLLIRTDTLMIAYFRSSYEVGQYTTAYPLASALLLVLSAFSFLYLPMASRLDADGRRETVDAIYKLTSKWIVIATMPVFVLFVAFSKGVVTSVFGEQYASAAPALLILSIGFFTNAAAGHNRQTLSAFGFTMHNLLVNAIALVVNIGLNLLLIPTYGFVGAAVASTISLLMLNGVAIGIINRRFSISPFSRQYIRTIIILIPLLLLSSFLFSNFVTLTPMNIFLLFPLIALETVLAVCFAGCLQPDDELLLNAIENRLGLKVPFIRQCIPTDETDDDIF